MSFLFRDCAQTCATVCLLGPLDLSCICHCWYRFGEPLLSPCLKGLGGILDFLAVKFKHGPLLQHLRKVRLVFCKLGVLAYTQRMLTCFLKALGVCQSSNYNSLQLFCLNFPLLLDVLPISFPYDVTTSGHFTGYIRQPFCSVSSPNYFSSH